MKKLIISVLLIIVLSMCSVVAFAEGESTDTGLETQVDATPATDTDTVTTDSTNTVTTSGIDKNDPLYLEIKSKYETLKGLRQTEAQIWESIKTQTSTNVNTEKQLRETLKKEIQNVKSSSQTQIQGIQEKTKTYLEQRKELLLQISEARKNKDTETVEKLKSQLEELNSTIASSRTNIKAVRESNKTDIDSAKAARDKIKQNAEQIKTLQMQMLQVRSEIHTAQALKDKEWIAFTQSMKSADLAGANTHMANILTYKQQIIDKLNSILSLKKQVGELLIGFSIDSSAAVPTSNATTESTTTPSADSETITGN